MPQSSHQTTKSVKKKLPESFAKTEFLNEASCLRFESEIPLRSDDGVRPMKQDAEYGEFTQEITEITPEVADEWLLSQFERQRKIRDHHVITLATEMENNSFIPHSSIVFAEYEGKRYLIDGQHRLKAISLYGKPVRMSVLSRKARSMQQVEKWYASIDQGLRRTARDAIRAQGLSAQLQITERQAGRLSGAVKLIATGFMDMTSGISAPEKKDRAKSRSNEVVSRLMRAWAEEAQSYFAAIAGGEPSNMYVFDRAGVIACGILTFRYSPDRAYDFWHEMSRDDGLSRTDPRKRFLLFLKDGKVRAGDVVRGFAVVWRAYLEKREITLIRFDKTKPVEINTVPLELEVAAAVKLATMDAEAEAEPSLFEAAE